MRNAYCSLVELLLNICIEWKGSWHKDKMGLFKLRRAAAVYISTDARDTP